MLFIVCRDRQKGGSSTEGGLPAQVASLANAVMKYASNIDNVSVILPFVERICHKHVSRGVKAIQYDAIGECLLFGMKQTLGDDVATPEFMEAWSEAYAFLAQTFIDMEVRLKAQLAEAAGYEGMVDMRVASVITNDKSCTIGFIPVSHHVPEFKDGQFVAIKVMLEDGSTSMATKKLVSNESNELTVYIPFSKEKSTIKLCEAKVDDVLPVSIPCGKPKAY